MKVLVRQATTGLYYQGAQLWVPDPNDAQAFPDTLQAFDFCSNYTTREAHIYLFTPDRESSVSIKPRRSTPAETAVVG